jgi:hypothetical protein
MNEETKEPQKLKVGDVVYRINSTMGDISKETIISVTKTKANIQNETKANFNRIVIRFFSGIFRKV